MCSSVTQALLVFSLFVRSRSVTHSIGFSLTHTPPPLLQVYHIARNMWSKMENRTVKNVSAPAAVIDDKIYIIGGRQWL